MVNVGLIGVGKMGLSHLAILLADENVARVVVCDSSGYLRGVLEKCSGLKTYDTYERMLNEEALDAVVIATPSRWHAGMTRYALERGFHVFCEKPFCLDPRESRELAALAVRTGVVNQVGYHYRFVGTFNEAKRLLEARAIGKIHHVRVEAYGPVVLRPTGGTWRMSGAEGGGCLYDYACHAIDLVNYLVGPPCAVSGVKVNRIFSADVDDEVYATLHFENGAAGQLAANWSDESFRRMWLQVSVWGPNGRLVVDRQELKCFVRDPGFSSVPIGKGWTVRNITELTPQVGFYLRGEEYSCQMESFVQQIVNNKPNNVSSFESAATTDEVVALVRRAGEDGSYRLLRGGLQSAGPKKRSASFMGFWNRTKAALF